MGAPVSQDGLSSPTEPKEVSALTGFDPSRLRLERDSRDCTRILDGDGKVVALIEALSNGRWSIFTTTDKQYTKRSFGTVRLAFAWFRSGLFDAASAIEARSDETQSGSAEGESPVPQGDAQ